MSHPLTIFSGAARLPVAKLVGNDLSDTIDPIAVEQALEIVPYAIPRQCAATYYPETNVLVPIDAVAAKSNTPVSKMVIVHLLKTN